MDPSAIAGGLGALGGGIMSLIGQSSANKANREIAAEQRQWGSQMAWDQWQRQKSAMQNQVKWQVQDLKDAGLNPMLAVGKASPATPGGGQAPAGASAVAHNVMSGIGSSAMDAARYWREVKATNSQIDVNKALEQKAVADTSQAESTAKKVMLENLITKQYLPAIREQAQAERIKAEFNKTNANSDSWLSRIRQFVPFTGSVQSGSYERRSHK